MTRFISGIDRHDDQGGEPDDTSEAVEAQEHREADKRLQDEKRRGVSHADPPGRQRAAAGALDARVEVAIEDVVICAAGAAHRDRPNQEKEEMRDIRPMMGGEARERGRLPARREQKLPADGAVPARELNKGQRPGRRKLEDEAVGTRVREARAPQPVGSKRTRGQRLRLRRPAPARRRLLLRLLHLRGDLAGLAGEGDALLVGRL